MWKSNCSYRRKFTCCFQYLIFLRLLDSWENKPLNTQGRTDAEAETPILWSPDATNWLIGKDPDAGKDWRQEKKRTRGRDGWIASSTQWTWVWASSNSSWWWTGKPGMLQSIGLQRVRRDWVAEQNWTETLLFETVTKRHAHIHKCFQKLFQLQIKDKYIRPS